MSKFNNDKECRILLDWLLSHNDLTFRQIYNHLVVMGFDSPSNLAFSYAFFLSKFHDYINNPNIERVLFCFQTMIIHQYMEFYNYYPFIDSSGCFGYSRSSARDFE